MADILVGRKPEQLQLQKVFESKQSEFVAVYGRRRVGKTFLIRSFFQKKPCLFFQVSGIHQASLKLQLNEFKKQIEQTFYPSRKASQLQTPTNWIDALAMLMDAIQLVGGKRKVVLFFDEFPWMATRKSGLLQALDYYWNRFWVSNKQIKLVICGSAASWIIDNILNNKGGLHNRVTLRLRLEPFTLHETKLYLQQRDVKLNNQQILLLYLCIGGVPFYLSLVDKKLSAIQNINQLCFQKNAPLFNEFTNLFSSLFDQAEAHEQLIRLIGVKRQGLNRSEIEKMLHYKGGRLTKRLKELEEAGFIISFTPFGKERGTYYKLIDEYTLFYLTWIAPHTKSQLIHVLTEKHWEQVAQTAAWKAWSGYTFEMVCYKHIHQISKALTIPAGAIATTWRYLPTKSRKNEEGAQIDLLFNRPDGIVQICEIKYCASPYKLDKEYAKALVKKVEIYQKITKTKKQIFVSMITSYYLQKTMYSEDLIASEVILEDLFEEK